MAVAAASMTVEEFQALPDIEGFETELHHGEVVRMSRPKKRHYDRVIVLQSKIAPVSAKFGFLVAELAYRAIPEGDLRAGDLAYVPRSRWQSFGADDHLPGAPDFVVEVLSPSNSAEDIQETKQLCLANGCREFWLLFPRLRQIEVSTPAGSRMYRDGDTIRSIVFAGHSFAVADLLAEPF